MHNAATYQIEALSTWTVTVERDKHAPRKTPYLARAVRGKETVYGRFARTEADARAALWTRLEAGGY